MKKNLRIVSAAAAALLAVAPVAASAVSANADVILNYGAGITGIQAPTQSTTPTNVVGDGSASHPFSTNNWNAKDVIAYITDKVADVATKDNIKNNLVLPSGFSVAAVSDVKLVNSDNKYLSDKNDNKIDKTGEYTLQATITVSGFAANKHYNFGGTVSGHTVKASNEGTIRDIRVSIPVNVYDKSVKGNPFFSGLTNGQGTRQTYSDGQNVPAPTTVHNAVIAPNSVVNIHTMVQAMGIEAYNNSSERSSQLTQHDIDNAIVKQLKADKLIESDGTVKLPDKGWTLKLSYTNPKNGNSVSLNIVFNHDNSQEYENYPLIKSDVANGTHNELFVPVKQDKNNFNNAMGIINIKQGTKDWASEVLSHFTAEQSSFNSSQLRLTTDNLSSSDIDTSTPGIYKATLTATNRDGKKTTLDFNVAVTKTTGDLVETKTVLGSPNEVVRLVSIVDGKISYLSGDVVNQGQPIHVYTNDTKTVDGVSYTRVADPKNSNVWIETKHVVESKKTQKTILHAAYEYDANHKRVAGTGVLGAYKTVTVVGERTQLSDGTPVYKLENGNYIDARNVDPVAKTLTHNAYIYKSNGKAYTYKKTVKKGKKHVKKTYHKVIKKGTSKDVWGGKFKKVGKLTNVYRIGKNQYVKAGNFDE